MRRRGHFLDDDDFPAMWRPRSDHDQVHDRNDCATLDPAARRHHPRLSQVPGHVILKPACSRVPGAQGDLSSSQEACKLRNDSSAVATKSLSWSKPLRPRQALSGRSASYQAAYLILPAPLYSCLMLLDSSSRSRSLHGRIGFCRGSHGAAATQLCKLYHRLQESFIIQMCSHQVL